MAKSSDMKFVKAVGTFAVLFMVYLWLAPLLIKKPAGTPPRSGSNEETKMIHRTAAGLPPEPLHSPGTTPTPGSLGASNSFHGGFPLASPVNLKFQGDGWRGLIANPAFIPPGRHLGWGGGSMPPGHSNIYPASRVHQA